jgi:hypothetical protein
MGGSRAAESADDSEESPYERPLMPMLREVKAPRRGRRS